MICIISVVTICVSCTCAKGADWTERPQRFEREKEVFDDCKSSEKAVVVWKAILILFLLGSSSAGDIAKNRNATRLARVCSRASYGCGDSKYCGRVSWRLVLSLVLNLFKGSDWVSKGGEAKKESGRTL